MKEILIGALSFLCLAAAGIGAMVLHSRLPEKHLRDDTQATIRLVANIFVVMTSLVLGLMMNSARNTYESIDHNIHAFATDLVLLDRAVRAVGPEGEETRRRLVAYVQRAVGDAPVVENDSSAELLLEEVGTTLRAIKPADDQKAAIWNDARQLYREVVHQRWIIIEQSEGALPTPLVALVIAWLVAIFASFGYRAPKNAVVATTLVLAAFLMAGSIYLMLDMDVPSSGLIQASNRSLQRVLADLQQGNGPMPVR